MAKRKSGKELRKDYKALLDETKAIRKRIIKRAKELLKQYPDVPYGKKNAWSDEISSVSEYMKSFVITPQAGLNVIEKIEQWIADQHPHQQQKLFKEPEQKDFIEYHDDGDDQHPESQEHIDWLDKRIKEIEIEYDKAQTASYGTGLDYDSTAKEKVISKGGKLRAYKEILDYLQSH